MPDINPDKYFRSLDSEEDLHYIVLESDVAEQLFAAYYLDLELEPFQILSIKLLLGRFTKQGELEKFIDDNNLHWVFNNGWIRHGNEPGVSPYYFNKPNVMILWPAGHGKTTIVSSKFLPIFSICDNPNVRLQFIGKNDYDASSFSRSIRRELETNTRLKEDFGIFKPSDRNVAWSDQAFSVAQREYRDVRENFEFYGTNSHSELGKRCDSVFLDDTETPDTCSTPEMRRKFIEWVRIGPLTAPRPLWGKDGRGRVMIPKSIKWTNRSRYYGVGVVGTIFHPEGLYGVIQRDETFTSVKFDCFKDKKGTIPLCSKLMTIDDLMRERKSLGFLAFNKRYRNIPYNEEEMAFREAWFRGESEVINGQIIKHPGCLDYNTSFGDVDPRWRIFLGFDPASGSTTRWASQAAYTIIGYDEENDVIHLIDFLKIQDNIDRMLDHLLDGNPQYGIEGFYRKYSYQIGTVEKNAFGRWMVDNSRIKDYVDQKIIQPHTTGKNKLDPEGGVLAMGARFENGKFLIPYRLPSDREKAEDFIADMLMFPKEKKDLVMSTWVATVPIRNLNKKYSSWVAPGGRAKLVSIRPSL